MSPIPWPKPERTVKRPKPVKAFSEKRGGHKFPGLVSKSRRSFCRKQACIATGRRTGEVVTAQPWMPETLRAMCPYIARVVVAHLKSRGAGNPDAGNIVPCEWLIHDLVGVKGWAWLEKAARLMPVSEIAALQETKFLARQRAIAKNMERQ